MTPTRAKPPGRKVQVEPDRSFLLTVHPGPKDTFGLTLAETFDGRGDQPDSTILTTSPAQTARVLDAVLTAVRASGHTPGRLATHRTKPIRLTDSDGVRLTLILMATQPLTVLERIRAIVAGIGLMSVEETYYWYAKCVGPDHTRARKALRVLLSDPKPGEHR